MSQIESGSEPKKLFRYHIEENEKFLNQQKLFFYRTNRWRFNSRDHGSAIKLHRLKYPLLIASVFILAYDFTYGYKKEPAHH